MDRTVSRDLELHNTSAGSLLPGSLGSSGARGVTLAGSRVIVGSRSNRGQEGEGRNQESNLLSHDLRIAYPCLSAIGILS